MVTLQAGRHNAEERPLTFLIVDDDDVDRMGLMRAFRRHHVTNPVYEAHDGLEALDLLRGPGRVVHEPYIILLDLNMPRMSGIEFLDEIRADPALHTAIVFVLTTSNEERDRAAAYAHNVAGYIVKHDARTTFQDTVSLLERYGHIVEMP